MTFDVDLRRPVTDDVQPPQGEPGQCHVREFTLPSAYEARYTNFPHDYLARYRDDIIVFST